LPIRIGTSDLDFDGNEKLTFKLSDADDNNSIIVQ